LLSEFRLCLCEDKSIILKKYDRNQDAVRHFAQSVEQSLRQRPRSLECKFLYDRRGSELYEQICAQPEYYPTRPVAAILSRYAKDLPALTGPVNLVELGSGSSTKTSHLLSAYQSKRTKLRYVPVDVSESALRGASQSISRKHPDAQFIGINGTYDDAAALTNCAAPVMVLFLGSSLGNFSAQESDAFFTRMARQLPVGSFFLLGVDLVKDKDLLQAAYNDAAGVTAQFTNNLFGRMNRELGAKLNLEQIGHEAYYQEKSDRIEIYARFQKRQTIRIEPLHTEIEIEAGEKIQTEISRKYRLNILLPKLKSFGFSTRKVMTDERDWFALLLLQRDHIDGDSGN